MTEDTPQSRIASIDQCRGFAIVAMVGGNFAGKFAFMPWILTHHQYGLTIAELFAPIFFFTVGIGFRLSFLKRVEREGQSAARRAASRRYVLIMVLGFIVYLDHLWDALTHIGMAGLLVLPFIDRGPRVRALVAVLYVALFQVLFLWTDYGPWLMARRLNGGPLGALSWAFIVLMGTLAYDALATGRPRKVIARLLLYGLALCAAGWLLSLGWPGLKEPWLFTRYGMTAPLPVFTAGTSFLCFLAFYWICDVRRFRFPVLSPVGENPLVMYLLLGLLVVLSKVIIHFTHEPGFWAALLIYAGMCAICYVVARMLQKRSIHLRL